MAPAGDQPSRRFPVSASPFCLMSRAPRAGQPTRACSRRSASAFFWTSDGSSPSPRCSCLSRSSRLALEPEGAGALAPSSSACARPQLSLGESSGSRVTLRCTRASGCSLRLRFGTRGRGTPLRRVRPVPLPKREGERRPSASVRSRPSSSTASSPTIAQDGGWTSRRCYPLASGRSKPDPIVVNATCGARRYQPFLHALHSERGYVCVPT